MANGKARVLVAVAVSGVLTGCSGPQSALETGGVFASEVRLLTDIMFVGSIAGTLLVTFLMIGAFFRRGEHRPSRRLMLFGGGIALPAVVLTPLVWHSASLGGSMRDPGKNFERVIVEGYQFWWQFRYERPEGQPEIITANEFRIPVNRPTEVLLKSGDVLHSFWVPSIAGKTDLIPGRVNRMVLRPTREGVYRGACYEFCGAQHANMAFHVEVTSEEDYREWLATRTMPATPPQTPILQAGQDLFLSQGCGACHRVHGLDGADGRLGPDLTHVGSRRTIGAGLLPGGVGNIAGWIASAQHLKPGNKMPSFDRMTGEELRALSSYLDSLK